MSAKVCAGCGFTPSEEARFCPRCGNTLTRPQVAHERVAVFAGHRDVAQNHLRLEHVDGSQAFGSRRRQLDIGAGELQDFEDGVAGPRIVVDEEHTQIGERVATPGSVVRLAFVAIVATIVPGFAAEPSIVLASTTSV